ncbi:MAG: PAS domain-containing protein [Proteobacteria bacterium]|nr:PAS domain-containing protein [Pseudomonadota bacterium]
MDATFTSYSLLEGLGEGFYAVDAGWRMTVFNSIAAEWFGFSEQEALGRTLWELLPRVLGSDYEISYHRVMESREAETFITRSLTRPGRFIEVRAFPLGDGLGAGFRDVTERVEQERELRQALARKSERLSLVEQAAEAAGLGFWSFDLKSGDLTWDERTRELYGLAPGAPVDFAIYRERMHPDDWDAVQERYAEAINQPGGGDYAIEHRAFGPDGEVHHLVGVGRVICDPDGEPLRVLGFTREK